MASTKSSRIKNILLLICLTSLFLVNIVRTSEVVLHEDKYEGYLAKPLVPYPKRHQNFDEVRHQNWLVAGKEKQVRKDEGQKDRRRSDQGEGNLKQKSDVLKLANVPNIGNQQVNDNAEVRHQNWKEKQVNRDEGQKDERRSDQGHGEVNLKLVGAGVENQKSTVVHHKLQKLSKNGDVVPVVPFSEANQDSGLFSRIFAVPEKNNEDGIAKNDLNKQKNTTKHYNSTGKLDDKPPAAKQLRKNQKLQKLGENGKAVPVVSFAESKQDSGLFSGIFAVPENNHKDDNANKGSNQQKNINYQYSFKRKLDDEPPAVKNFKKTKDQQKKSSVPTVVHQKLQKISEKGEEVPVVPFAESNQDSGLFSGIFAHSERNNKDDNAQKGLNQKKNDDRHGNFTGKLDEPPNSKQLKKTKDQQKKSSVPTVVHPKVQKVVENAEEMPVVPFAEASQDSGLFSGIFAVSENNYEDDNAKKGLSQQKNSVPTAVHHKQQKICENGKEVPVASSTESNQDSGLFSGIFANPDNNHKDTKKELNQHDSSKTVLDTNKIVKTGNNIKKSTSNDIKKLYSPVPEVQSKVVIKPTKIDPKDSFANVFSGIFASESTQNPEPKKSIPSEATKPLEPYPKRGSSNIFKGIFSGRTQTSEYSNSNPTDDTNEQPSKYTSGFRQIFTASVDQDNQKFTSQSDFPKKPLEPYSKRIASNPFRGIFAVSDIQSVGDPKNVFRRPKREAKNFCTMDQCECVQTRGNHYIITCHFENREVRNI